MTVSTPAAVLPLMLLLFTLSYERSHGYINSIDSLASTMEKQLIVQHMSIRLGKYNDQYIYRKY